jgi:hypothetical protein
VVSKADEYEANAQECERTAAKLPESHLRTQYLNLAKEWRAMAADLREHEARFDLKSNRPL